MTTPNEHHDQSTVLCVDDEPHVLSALERVLRSSGCRVLQASDGGSALDILEREQVEVLICDEAMPGICGIEVLRQAKTVSPRTARILLTAHCYDKAVVIPAVNEGEIFRLLSKPWEDQEIRRAVADALALDREPWPKREGVAEHSEPDRSAAGASESTTR